MIDYLDIYEIKKTYIYGLYDPRYPDLIRYVGKANNVMHRYQNHINAAKRGDTTRVYNWIRKIVSDGVFPEVKVIKELYYVDDIEWWDLERYYIRYYREQGPGLTNIDNGGRGCGRCSEETKLKLHFKNKGKRGTRTGIKHSEETKQKMRNSAIGKTSSEETRYKMSVSQTGRKHTEEAKARIGAASKLRKTSEETRIKSSLSHLGHKQAPDTIRRKTETRMLNKQIQINDVISVITSLVWWGLLSEPIDYVPAGFGRRRIAKLRYNKLYTIFKLGTSMW